MAENAEDIISKQQIVLDNFFNLLGSFAFDKAKEYLEKERDIAVKNHTVAPFFTSAQSAFALLAAAEKTYANLTFMTPKGFLRKENSLKSTYESLLNEYQRLEDKHYITPISTPATSPTSSCATPSPPLGLPSPSPISACSEAMGSIPGSIGIASSVRGSSNSLHTYLGEDILENLASHLCGQLLCYVRARLKTVEFYEKMYAMSSTKFMKFDLLLSSISEIVKSNLKLFHHPMLSPVKTSFSFECEILMKLLEAEIHMQNWRFLPSLLCLHDAHSKLGAWLALPKELKKSAASGSFRTPSVPPLYNWLRSLKAALVSKFTLYFHEILSKQTSPNEMKTFCSKANFDYVSKIISFQKRYDVACVAIVLDTDGLTDFTGHGYMYPGKICEAPKGLDSFPPIVSYPPITLIREKHLLHWPSVIMNLSKKEQEQRNTDAAVSFYDPKKNTSYFLSKIEHRMTLVVIFESKKTEKDTYIHRFMNMLCTQLRGNKVFTMLKPGSK